MPRFFIQPLMGDTALLAGEDAAHIAKSLRMRVGDEVTLCDSQGTDYRCSLLSVDPGEVTAQVLERTPSLGEPKVFIRLYQAMPKSDKMDWIVQKAVELGVGEIVPVISRYCVSRPDAKSMEKKRQRLAKIALEAAKQSGRGRVPQIGQLLDFSQAVEQSRQQERSIIFYEGSHQPLTQLLPLPVASVGVFVGSEGGFAPEEVALAQQCGVQPATLGNRILRCETASVCALSVLQFYFGEMD